MTVWSDGYVLDIQYTTGFYRELAPSHLEFVALISGIVPPYRGEGATYCELGCGQGFGLNLLAAANPAMQFWGFDFNPAQITNANRLAREAGLQNVTFRDLSFAEAVQLPKDALPSFDFIVLHGIYSWISDENRRAIVSFIEQRLKPGGLVYVSYNCMPGWAQVAPLQRLLREHAIRHPDRSDLQVDAAVKFAQGLTDGGANYFKANPGIAPRMAKFPTMNRNYLAHEYLNGYWNPLYHLDVAREMEPARLTYVGSATISENIDVISVPAGLQPMLAASRDRGWQETIRDFAANKQFRRDIFMRGATPLHATERSARIEALHVALTVPRDEVMFKFQGPLGETTGHEPIYRPIADALAGGQKSVGALAALPELRGVGLGGVLQAVAMFVHAGQVQPVETVSALAGRTTQAFNKAVAARAVRGEPLSFLASAASGSGVTATYSEMVGVHARLSGKAQEPIEIAEYGWSFMERSGTRMMKEGKTLAAKEENVAALGASLSALFNNKWPIWSEIGVV